MTPGARLETAIALLDEAGEAEAADRHLDSHFRAHRYIGSKDRQAIAAMVWGVLRERAMIDWRLGGAPAGNRLRVLAHLLGKNGWTPATLAAACDGGRHRPRPLDEAEIACLQRAGAGEPREAPLVARCNIPEWLLGPARAAFGDDIEAELEALAGPAPVDLRVNLLRSDRPAVLAELHAAGIAATPTALSPLGIRLEHRAAIGTWPAFRRGAFEVQDEGAQLATLLVGARPGMRVLDYCAGAGGKTLALAAAIGNDGVLLAQDSNPDRMRPLAARARRAGATVIEIVDRDRLATEARFDRVLIDAPCSGSGVWRRRPDARWRLAPERLQAFARAQDAILDQAANFVRVGGRLVYVTCSFLRSENEERIAPFLERHPGFEALPAAAVWREGLGESASGIPVAGPGLRLTPRRHGTDGFFIATVERRR